MPRRSSVHLPVVVRETCGTLAGAMAHLEAGEPQCGWCRRAELAAILAAEAAYPAPRAFPAPLEPVSSDRAALNRNILDAEVLAFEQEHKPRRKRSAA